MPFYVKEPKKRMDLLPRLVLVTCISFCVSFSQSFNNTLQPQIQIVRMEVASQHAVMKVNKLGIQIPFLNANSKAPCTSAVGDELLNLCQGKLEINMFF